MCVLSDNERILKENMRGMCKYRLGRDSQFAPPTESNEDAPDPITIDELVNCLKRILKSLDKWNRAGRKQGYLTFISQFG